MPVSILFAYSEEAKTRALVAGFIERPCLIRYEETTEESKAKAQSEILNKICPYQCVVSQSYWGMGPD